jgi:hypothetical protein
MRRQLSAGGRIERLTFDELATIMADGPVANVSLTRFDGSSGRRQLVEYDAVPARDVVSRGP